MRRYSIFIGVVLVFVALDFCKFVGHPVLEEFTDAMSGRFGDVMMVVVGGYLALVGLLPLGSPTVHRLLVRPDPDDTRGRKGLVILGVLGIVFIAIGVGSILCPQGHR